VRVWHSPTGQMGARINPTYGFIYPAKAKLHDFTPDPTLGASVRFARVDPDLWDMQRVAAPQMLRQQRPTPMPANPRMIQVAQTKPAPSRSARSTAPRLEADPFVVEYADANPSPRTLSAIIADVQREAAMN